MALTVAAAAPVAAADVFGPDESIQAAGGPLAAGTVYSGTFVSAQDIDYLSFEVPQPETLRFDVANTLTSCRPYMIQPAPGEPAPYIEPYPACPLWATLIDEAGQQLGGEGSAAGTGRVEYHSYEEVEWTFSAPGRYYVVLESDYCGGHEAECQLPSFTISYNVVPPVVSGGGGGGSEGKGTGGTGGSGGSGAGGGSGSKSLIGSTGGRSGGSSTRGLVEPFAVSGSRSLVQSLTVPARERGNRVIVHIVLAQRLASLDLRLFARAGPHRRLALVGHRLRRHPLAGPESIAVPVKPGRWLGAKRYTPLLLRVRALAGDGAVESIQGRLLLRR